MKPCKCCGSTNVQTTRSENGYYITDLMRIKCNQCGHSEPVWTWGVVSPEVVMENVYHVWPDETLCVPEELEEYLTFMSDDYLTVHCDMSQQD